MQWIRRNNRFGAWAGLFALGLQLVLSFGHIHLADIQGSSATIVALTQGANGGAHSKLPAQGDHKGAGHDLCPICAAVSLTSNSVLPTVAPLPAPIDSLYEWILEHFSQHISLGIHFNFQARGPPLSI
jgi:hypothetical protein